MATTFDSSFFCLLMILIPSAAAITAPEISAICDKSMNRNFCANFLQSTPGISTAGDIAGVGGIVLDVSSKKAEETKEYVKTTLLGNKATDPRVKAAYETCLENYDDAVSDISDAKAALGSKDNEGANLQASAAQTEMDTCGDEMVNKGTTSSELPERNQYLFDVLDIVLVIANKLNAN